MSEFSVGERVQVVGYAGESGLSYLMRLYRVDELVGTVVGIHTAYIGVDLDTSRNYSRELFLPSELRSLVVAEPEPVLGVVGAPAPIAVGDEVEIVWPRWEGVGVVESLGRHRDGFSVTMKTGPMSGQRGFFGPKHVVSLGTGPVAQVGDQVEIDAYAGNRSLNGATGFIEKIFDGNVDKPYLVRVDGGEYTRMNRGEFSLAQPAVAAVQETARVEITDAMVDAAVEAFLAVGGAQNVRNAMRAAIAAARP